MLDSIDLGINGRTCQQKTVRTLLKHCLLLIVPQSSEQYVLEKAEEMVNQHICLSQSTFSRLRVRWHAVWCIMWRRRFRQRHQEGMRIQFGIDASPHGGYNYEYLYGIILKRSDAPKLTSAIG